MYMPGRLRTASSPLRILMLEESYSPTARSLLSSGTVAIEILSLTPLDAHRHHDVLEILAARQLHERARARIAQRERDFLRLDMVEHVEQIRNVEADVE